MLQGEDAVVPELLIITGPPGAGKSTVAELVAERFDRCALVRGDTFFGFVARGYIDPWLPESNEQNEVVTRATATAAGRFAQGGYTTIFDGMVGPWFLPTFLEYSGLWSVHYAVLMPGLDTCVARVRDREGHGFQDESVTRQMYESFATSQLDARHIVAGRGDALGVAREVLQRFEDRTLPYPTMTG
jgi:cytidylate kinase